MANPPFSFFAYGPFGESSSAAGAQMNREIPILIEQLVRDISDANRREHAIAELAKRKDSFPELAPILWHSFGTITAFLQEITSIYRLLSPPALSDDQANRICNALALLQCVAAHPETRSSFLAAQIPEYLYVFLDTTERTRPFEYLRLTSLGVIGALVKVNNPEAIQFMLSSEIIPKCLKSMEIGCDLSKTVATFIVENVLLDNEGLEHVCSTPEKFYSVARVLFSMANELVQHPSPRLLKHIICCFLRLSEKRRACDVLKYRLPAPLRDGSLIQCLMNDDATRSYLDQLLYNLQQRLMAQQLEAGYGPSVIN